MVEAMKALGEGFVQRFFFLRRMFCFVFLFFFFFFFFFSNLCKVGTRVLDIEFHASTWNSCF